MINFNVPPYVGTELEYVREAAEVNHKICGDGPFSRKCHTWMEDRFNAEKVMLTTSGTSALEMAAVLCDLNPGDEVILPSYTFSSTATAFQAVGASLVFVDIDPATMNIDPDCIEAAITDRTRVIVAVHYAGVACDMDRIVSIAHNHGLLVVEDAAQGVMSTYHDRYLGTIGTFGCYSFHETKNYSMGEGGAIVINDPRYIERAEIIREKGTNRQRFCRGRWTSTPGWIAGARTSRATSTPRTCGESSRLRTRSTKTALRAGSPIARGLSRWRRRGSSRFPSFPMAAGTTRTCSISSAPTWTSAPGSSSS